MRSSDHIDSLALRESIERQLPASDTLLPLSE